MTILPDIAVSVGFMIGLCDKRLLIRSTGRQTKFADIVHSHNCSFCIIVVESVTVVPGTVALIV